MTRIRISTTVDEEQLTRSRALVGGRDTDVLDAAFRALLEKHEAASDLVALNTWPYSADPEVEMPLSLSDDRDGLSYSGEVPTRIHEIAERSRAQRAESK